MFTHKQQIATAEQYAQQAATIATSAPEQGEPHTALLITVGMTGLAMRFQRKQK